MSITEATVEIVKSALSNNAIVLNNYSYSDDEAAEQANSFNRKQIENFITTTYAALKKVDKAY